MVNRKSAVKQLECMSDMLCGERTLWRSSRHDERTCKNDGRWADVNSSGSQELMVYKKGWCVSVML